MTLFSHDPVLRHYFVAVLKPFPFHFVLHYYNTTLPWLAYQSTLNQNDSYYIPYLWLLALRFFSVHYNVYQYDSILHC